MFDPEGPVLGVDPGVSRCGFGVVAREGGGRFRALAFGVITTSGFSVLARFTAMGLDPVGNSPAEFAQYIRTDIDKWTRLVRELDIAPQ